MSPGRPTDFTPELADCILDRIAEGESLRQVCADEEMPSRTAVYTWLSREEPQFKDFAHRYARAVEDRAEKLADEILSIADDDSDDIGFKEADTKEGKSAVPFIKMENIQRDRLRVDSRKWIASKLFPRKYGDFQRTEGELTHKGGVTITATPLDEKL